MFTCTQEKSGAHEKTNLHELLYLIHKQSDYFHQCLYTYEIIELIHLNIINYYACVDK